MKAFSSLIFLIRIVCRISSFISTQDDKINDFAIKSALIYKYLKV